MYDLTDPDDPDPLDELRKRAGDDLVLGLAAIGVHVDEIRFGVEPPLLGTVIVSARLGDLAFSDRVEHPDQATFDDRFADLAETLMDDDYEAIRRHLMGHDDD